MSAIPMLDDEEAYLAAILDDPSGIELAEFCFLDETPGKPDPCFRVRDYQWPWWMNESRYQIDHCSRDVGKSQGIQLRAFAFPFNFPGQEMLITAPELNHLGPVVDKIEALFMRVRLGRELLPRTKGGGIKHQPQFQATFINGAKIMGRLPNKDGKGVKGSIAEGTLVLTPRGQVLVESLQVGDLVWTHEGRWQPITFITGYVNEHVVTVEGAGHRGLTMSDNHRMWVRRNANPQRARNLSTPSFQVVADLDQPGRYYMGSPTKFPDEGIPAALDRDELLWVAGRYVADGFLAKRRVHVIVRAGKVEDVVGRMVAAGLRPTSRRRANGTYDVEFSSVVLRCALLEHFGELAQRKSLPFWLLGCRESARRAFLDGYLSGDGHWSEAKGRWELGTASKSLAVGLRLLGQTLGYSASLSWVDPKVTEVRGRLLVAAPRRSWRVQLKRGGHALVERNVAWRKIRRVVPASPTRVYNLAVAHDHSYVADGLISHNQHSHRLEMDEAQDYPNAGWMELVETMRDTPGAQWRAHGVSRGVRDMYYRLTQRENPDLPFFVHRYMAMHRPNWSEDERRAKIAIYGGSPDNPDYKRNVYGEHGDVANRVFVLARLMACVRINESTWASEYNDNVYARRKLEFENIEHSGMPIEAHLRLPKNHLLPAYKSYWAGLDVGFTNDPSELLVFGQLNVAGRDLLRLLARLHMMRISAMDQAKVILEVFDFYGPRMRTLAMDKTGNGLPIWQETMRGGRLHRYESRIKGYGFSEKKAVEFDDRPLQLKEKPEDAVIEKNVVEYACVDEDTEALTKRGWLSWDKVTLADELLTLNPITGDAEWNPVERVSIYRGDIPVIEHGSRSFSAVTTAGHKWFTEVQLADGGVRQEWRTSATLRKATRVPRARRVVNLPTPTVPDEIVDLVAWTWTEGHWKSGSRFEISQSPKVNPENVALIEQSLLMAFGEPARVRDGGLWYSYDTNQGTRVFELCKEASACLVGAFTDLGEKVVAGQWLAQLDQAQLDRFIALSLRADGYKHGTSWSLAQKSERRIAAFQMACSLAGQPTNVSGAGDRWLCRLTHRSRVSPMKLAERTVPLVWCPTVKHHLWLARRRGAVYFTGNTDKLREYVDGGQIELPYDQELLTEWQGQVVVYARDDADRSRRSTRYGGGSFHTLDSAKMMILGKELEAIEATLAPRRHGPVLDQFFVA